LIRENSASENTHYRASSFSGSRQKAFVVLAQCGRFLICVIPLFIACETTASLCAGNKIKTRQNIYTPFPTHTHMASRIRKAHPSRQHRAFCIYLAQQQQQYNSKKTTI
jgi:hypothetical protein